MFEFLKIFTQRGERKRRETAKIDRLEADLRVAVHEQSCACQSTISSASSLHEAVQDNAVKREETTRHLRMFLEAQEEAPEPVPVEVETEKREAVPLRKTQPLKPLGIQGQSA